MQLVRILYTQDDTRDGHRGLQAQDPRGASSPRSSRTTHSKNWVLGQVPQHRPLRHRRRPDRDRRRRGRAPVLQQARRRTSRCARPRCSPACRRRRRSTRRCDNPSGTKARRNEVLGKMAELGMITPGDGRRPRWPRASGCTWTGYFQQGPRALRARLRQVRADQGVRRRRGPARRPAGLHDDRPQEAAARRATAIADNDRATSARRRRSSRSTPERRHPRDGLRRPTGATRASRSSTSPPRATASPARRSRSWR